MRPWRCVLLFTLLGVSMSALCKVCFSKHTPSLRSVASPYAFPNAHCTQDRNISPLAVHSNTSKYTCMTTTTSATYMLHANENNKTTYAASCSLDVLQRLGSRAIGRSVLSARCSRSPCSETGRVLPPSRSRPLAPAEGIDSGRARTRSSRRRRVKAEGDGGSSTYS